MIDLDAIEARYFEGEAAHEAGDVARRDVASAVLVAHVPALVAELRQRRAKSPAEERADEIGADRMWKPLTVRGAINVALVACDDEKPDEAAAWLIVAQRILAREAAR